MKKCILLICFTVNVLLAQNPHESYIVKNVNIIPMNENVVLKNQDVIIKEGKIVSICKSKKSALSGLQEIDGKGKYMMPSLSDAHVHFPENEEEMERVMRLNVINGVTKLRSMRGDWKHIEWREKFNKLGSYYPKLYISPPPISRQHDLSIEQIDQFVMAAKKYNFDFIKILSVKNENILKQIDSVCKSQNISLAGHFLDNPRGVRISDEVFFNSNYKSFEHLGGLTGDSESFDSRIQYITNTKMYVCPTLLWYDIGSGQYDSDYLLNQNGMQYFTTETKMEWVAKTNLYKEKTGKEAIDKEILDEQKMLREKFQVVKKLNDLGVKLLLSPDASSKYMVPGFAVFEEMKLYQKSELNNYDILKTTTVNFASLFNENYGTIEVGKDADFILLDENPLESLKTLQNINGVFYNNIFLNEIQLKKIAKGLEIIN
jgi:alpha-D-ribose 1-methylphosphonate 5-triphosphate diphosphatase PhnM